MPKISVLTVTYILTVLVCFSQNEISFEKGEIKTKLDSDPLAVVGVLHQQRLPNLKKI